MTKKIIFTLALSVGLFLNIDNALAINSCAAGYRLIPVSSSYQICSNDQSRCGHGSSTFQAYDSNGNSWSSLPCNNVSDTSIINMFLNPVRKDMRK